MYKLDLSPSFYGNSVECVLDYHSDRCWARGVASPSYRNVECGSWIVE